MPNKKTPKRSKYLFVRLTPRDHAGMKALARRLKFESVADMAREALARYAQDAAQHATDRVSDYVLDA